MQDSTLFISLSLFSRLCDFLGMYSGPVGTSTGASMIGISPNLQHRGRAVLERVNLTMEDLKFYEENLSDFYSIFKATESLELAFSRNSLGFTKEAYYGECTKLIAEFKRIERILVGEKIRSTEEFIQRYNLRKDCPRACQRFQIGAPESVSDNRYMFMRTFSCFTHVFQTHFFLFLTISFLTTVEK